MAPGPQPGQQGEGGEEVQGAGHGVWDPVRQGEAGHVRPGEC